jgi:diacylglycerol kinase (ATP)
LTLEETINSAPQNPETDINCFVNGRCLRVGVLTNPLSGGNKNGGRGVREVLSRWPNVIQREASTPQDIARALNNFAEKSVELVVINGGDGTIQAALTTLGNEKIFTRAPLLALLCAGTTSMLPRDVGVAGDPGASLERVLEWSKSTSAVLTVCSRHILRVQRSSGAALFGMFFGAGAICHGIRTFHSKDNPKGRRGQLMPTITMLRLLLAILSGNRKKVPPFLTKTSLDGDEPVQRSDTFVIVSTLDRLFLGMRPYWGKEDGPLRYTAITSAPRHLLRVMVSLFRVRKSRHATPENGYVSHNVQSLQLEIAGDFTLDGELFEVGEGPLSVSSAGPALFLCSR